MNKRREESCGSELKMKGKMEEVDMMSGFMGGVLDRNKYKKLEMPIFAGVKPETWVYRAEHYFEINNVTEAENVKVVVVSFTQDEVD